MRSIWRWSFVILALGGCSSDRQHPAVSHPQGEGALRVVPITARGVQALAERGEARATLVNVWATWCAPCREEFPALLRVARAQRHEGLRLVLVSADFEDQLPAVRRFLLAHGVTDTTYLKTGNDMEFINTMDPHWTGAIPATFVYDRRGRRTAFWEGKADEARFTASVNEAFTSQSIREDARP